MAAMPDKTQTYTVDGGNADLRYDLARLGRKARCFSRCSVALRRALKRFVWCYNQRQV
jgi:IS1 family transposase